MKNEHIKELYEIFVNDESLQKEHKELFHVLELLDENIDLVEKSNKITEELQKIMNK